MKIAILTSDYPTKDKPENNSVVRERCLNYMDDGHDVTVFVPSKDGIKYFLDGVLVRKISNLAIIRNIKDFDIVCIHKLNFKLPFKKTDGLQILDHLMKSDMPLVWYLYGDEIKKKREECSLCLIFLDAIKNLVVSQYIKKIDIRPKSSMIFPNKRVLKDFQDTLDILIVQYDIVPAPKSKNYSVDKESSVFSDVISK